LFERYDTELKLTPELSFKDLRYFITKFRHNQTYQDYTKFEQKPTVTFDYQAKKEENEILGAMIGQHPTLLEVKNQIKKMEKVEIPILIFGETGTGKDLVAKALWKSGSLKNKKFIAINCGSLSDHLLQSELFGHKKGAFTGAIQDHKGFFEDAQGGIVFLDEIGEISPKMQISLLRVLESGEFRPIGGNETKNLNCKIIFATNRLLSDLVKKGLFRQDLQYRLERLIINLPPLRDRLDDIPILTDYFLNKQHPHLHAIAIDHIALEHLKTLPWEGNIRELRNEMERIRLFHSDKKMVTIEDFSDKYRPLTNTNVKRNQEVNSKPLPLDNKHLNLKSKFRKLDELKDLFNHYGKLSRSEAARLLSVSLNTSANYLSTLEKEGYIKKITPTNSVKTHYYEIAISQKKNL
jgi:DNA-binding NtrC family response regulator